MQKIPRLFVICALILATLGVSSASNAQPARASVDVNQPPFILVNSGVSNFSLMASKLFWYTGVPGCPPGAPTGPDIPQGTNPETVKRIAYAGSNIRTLFLKYQDCGAREILSNLVANTEGYIYWLEAGGLMKYSINANPGDLPTLMNALVSGPGEIADAGDRIYVLESSGEMSYVLKSNNQKVVALGLVAGTHTLKTDTKYAYYITTTGNLIRYDPTTGYTNLLATLVHNYYPEQHLVMCYIGQGCVYTYKVYISKGHSIYLYDNSNSSLSPAIYTASDSTATIENMVTDSTNLYFFESVTGVCDITCTYTYSLYRTPRSGGTPSGWLANYAPISQEFDMGLDTDGSFLFWMWAGGIQRLPNDAGVAVVANLIVTGMEITQGIQKTDNSVLLINDKRTFVRVYVKSNSGSVPGVTGLLSAVGQSGDPLLPVNSTGTRLTVRAHPNRTDLEQSFLFELPKAWTQLPYLTLDFVMNPYKYPLETSYSDNAWEATVTFMPSPTLSVEIFRLNYTLNGVTYKPRMDKDVLQMASWLSRAYPIGGPLGKYLKVRVWEVDAGSYLGSLVNRTNPDCLDAYGDPNDDVSLCASYYMNGWLDEYRDQTSDGDLNVGLKVNAFYYGMITDSSGYFPRGQAIYDQTSVGPAGIPGQVALASSAKWDFDNSYADWYGAHEVGHSLGRSHPDAGSDDPATTAHENCGHSRSDSNYPYGSLYTARAPIGPSDGSIEGFDWGAPGYGVSRAIYPSKIWSDVMSYCQSQWISDYTYTGMWAYMFTHPSGPQPAGQMLLPSNVTGSFLVASGEVVIDPGKASFAYLGRASKVTSKSVDDSSGAYALRFVGANSFILATHPFLGVVLHDANRIGFNEVVDYPAGTQKIQILRRSDNTVILSKTVSANAPLVSSVALQSPPNPVTGVVTLNWSASDLDNDPLNYSVSYSLNGGTTFTPVATNLSAKTTQVDTSVLAGSSSAVFRVTASDGVNTGSADSPAYVMATKPPQPQITSPADNTHIHYGQLVNFEGLALDATDNFVDDSGFVWKDSHGNQLGAGAQISLTDLPVGTDVITLQATNSQIVSATTTVTVIVDDDLSQPGATLTVSPVQVGWQLIAGDAALQTFDLKINNSGGSDTMSWTASSDQPWLELSAASGSVLLSGDASTLTLTADPTGLQPGQSWLAHVTITKPLGGGTFQQVVTIPVFLSMGDVIDQPAQPFNYVKLFLPVVTR